MAIANDINEIFSRLFDHRPFLRAEINNFKSEFEDKRQDQEVEQLFRALEITSEIKEVQVDKVVLACDEHLPRTIADVQVALRMCQTALQPGQTEEILAARRTAREARLARARSDVAGSLAAIDATFDAHEKRLRLRLGAATT